MRFEGSFTVRAPPEQVLAFFLDPRELSACIEDPHTIEAVDADTFRGTIKAGVAFIRGTFTWSARIVERRPPERARLTMHGSGMGSAFDIEAQIEARPADGGTLVRWLADVTLSGTIASVGARLLRGTVDKKTGEFFENARRRLEAPGR